MSTPVQPRKKVFWDNDGNLLQNGKIYVGDPNKDPRSYPATVTFEDSSGATFTAVQPLRTINGKIVYNGLPIIATVAGEHSLLVADSTDVILDYTASIPVDSTTGTNYTSLIQVGLTLPDVKALDVSVGNVVRSVGRVTATDGLGADWLVVSATGSSADDVDIIDFDNGLQGQRDVSKIYFYVPSKYKAFNVESLRNTTSINYQKWRTADLTLLGTDGTASVLSDGIGSIAVNSSAAAGSSVEFKYNVNETLNTNPPSWGKAMYWATKIQCYTSVPTNLTFHVAVGYINGALTITTAHIGFVIKNDGIYASAANNTTRYISPSAIASIDTNEHLLEIITDGTGNSYLYVDSALKASLTTSNYVPTSASELNSNVYFNAATYTSAIVGSAQTFLFSPFNFTMEN